MIEVPDTLLAARPADCSTGFVHKNRSREAINMMLIASCACAGYSEGL